MAKIKVNVFNFASGNEPVGKNFSIAVSDWTLENEKYFVIVQDARLNLNKFADVFFDENCLETVKGAKISAEIAEVNLRSGSEDMFVYTNVIAIKFTAENLPTDSISGVYYLFEEENYMAKVRLNPCNGSSGAGLNSVSITGGAATLSGGYLTIEIDSQTDENFTTAEKTKLAGIDTSQFVTIESGKGLSTEDFTTADKLKLNSVENNAQENIIESIYFNGVELPIDAKAVSISAAADIRHNPNFAVNPSSVTLNYGDITTFSVTSDSPAPFNFYAVSDKISASLVGDNQVQIRNDFMNQTDTSVNFYQIATQNFKDAYFDLPIHINQYNALRAILHFDNNLLNSVTDVNWNSTAGYVSGKFGTALATYTNMGGGWSMTPSENIPTGGDFSFDFWAFVKTQQGGGSDFFLNLSDVQLLTIKSIGQIQLLDNTAQTLSVETWHHVAIEHDSTAQTTKLFLDGNLLDTKNNSTFAFDSVFKDFSENYNYNNYVAIDELRIFSGAQAWTENFTPPTEPYQL